MYRQDFVKRQIELLAQALARMVSKRCAGECDDALDEAQAAYRLLGVDSGLLRLDSRSLVVLLGSKERIAGLVELLEEEARIRAALGQHEQAEQLQRRARELLG